MDKQSNHLIDFFFPCLDKREHESYEIAKFAGYNKDLKNIYNIDCFYFFKNHPVINFSKYERGWNSLTLYAPLTNFLIFENNFQINYKDENKFLATLTYISFIYKIFGHNCILFKDNLETGWDVDKVREEGIF